MVNKIQIDSEKRNIFKDSADAKFKGYTKKYLIIQMAEKTKGDNTREQPDSRSKYSKSQQTV